MRIAIASGFPLYSSSICPRVYPMTNGSIASRCEGLGRQLQVYLFSGGCINVTCVAQVIFYITVSHREIWIDVAFEFCKNLFVCLPKNIGKDIEATAVSHADYDFLNPKFRRFIDDGLQCRDRILAAFQRKAFLP